MIVVVFFVDNESVEVVEVGSMIIVVLFVVVKGSIIVVVFFVDIERVEELVVGSLIIVVLFVDKAMVVLLVVRTGLATFVVGLVDVAGVVFVVSFLVVVFFVDISPVDVNVFVFPTVVGKTLAC